MAKKPKPQKYPNNSKFIRKGRYWNPETRQMEEGPEEVLVLYKNGPQYNLCIQFPNGGGETFHATEPVIDKWVEEAELYLSKIWKVLE